MSFYRSSILASMLLFTLAACTASPATPKPGPTLNPTNSPQPSNTPSATATQALPTKTALPPTATPMPKAQLCSPLDGLTLAQLPQIIDMQNPFVAPTPGQDFGHPGVDFSYWSRGTRTTMIGLPVYSALPGKVAAVIDNRNPYGNGIIIETSLNNLPSGWLGALQAPGPVPTVHPDPRMICSLPTPPASWDINKRSLYVLYGHFGQPAIVKPGDNVKCGQQIGAVGLTGMTSGPHLHFEVRVGPSGATFGPMAYYDTSETPQEISTYCEWRISQLFELIDPMKLLSLHP